jgi:hypothetical protein
MSAVTTHDFQSLHYFVALGEAAAATVAVFFGIAFLWLGPSGPAALPADAVPPAQALKADEGTWPGANDTVRDSSAGTASNELAASSTPAAPPNGEAMALVVDAD